MARQSHRTGLANTDKKEQFLYRFLPSFLDTLRQGTRGEAKAYLLQHVLPAWIAMFGSSEGPSLTDVSNFVL